MVLVAQTAIRFFTFVLAALRGSLGLVVQQLSCVTDVCVTCVVGRAVCLGCIKVNVYVLCLPLLITQPEVNRAPSTDVHKTDATVTSFKLWK